MVKIFISIFLVLIDLYGFEYLNRISSEKETFNIALKDKPILVKLKNIEIYDTNDFVFDYYFKIIGLNEYSFDYKFNDSHITVNIYDENERYSYNFPFTILEKEVIKEIVYEKVYINQTPKEKYENIQSNKESKPQVSLNDNNTNVHTDASNDSISFVLYNKNLSFDRDTDLGTIISSICASFSASENISLDYTQLNPSVPGSYNVFLYSASGKTECITVNIN